MISGKSKKLAVIVPVYNEEKIVGTVIEQLLVEAPKLEADIFVVNDGSTDRTLSVLERFKEKITIMTYKQNMGKGYALRAGTEKACMKKYELIAWIDGDGQLSPKDIGKMVSAIDDNIDMIINNRIINFKVLPTSKIGRGTVRFIFNSLFHVKISDHLSGLRVFRSKIYPKIKWTSNDYRIEVETLARAVINNVSYREVKTVCKKKLYRGIGWQDGLKIYYWIFWCFFNKRKLICKKDKYKDYTDYLINKSCIRAYIRRKFYLKNVLKFVKGKTIDFGCGVGEVLKYLPAGSIGLDPNLTSIEYCEKKKLNVKVYNPEKEKYSLGALKNQQFNTFLMNHVLEHIDSPQEVMTKILKEAERLNLIRVIVVVPCKKGFKADKTHIEYIDNDFFEKKLRTTDYKIIHKKYYPINSKIIGDIFRYQELVVVYERAK